VYVGTCLPMFSDSLSSGVKQSKNNARQHYYTGAGTGSN
jgi:hypothetical protein